MLTSHWRNTIRKELALSAIRAEILNLTDPGLRWILTPKDMIFISRLEVKREMNNKRAYRQVDLLFKSLGFSHKGYSRDLSMVVYERAYVHGERKIRTSILRVEFCYYETENGLVREFNFLINGLYSNKRRFLEILVMIRRQQREEERNRKRPASLTKPRKVGIRRERRKKDVEK